MLLIAVVLLTYGLAEKVQVSGMLAVFTAGLVMGNQYAQAVNPTIEIVARVHNDAQRELLGALPKTHCVQGEVELAYAMARIMLQTLGVSAIEAEASIIDARRGLLLRPHT